MQLFHYSEQACDILPPIWQIIVTASMDPTACLQCGAACEPWELCEKCQREQDEFEEHEEWMYCMGRELERQRIGHTQL